MKLIITGGAGFIGSHVVRLFVNKYPNYTIINLDKLTYAGNLENLRDVEQKPNYRFIKADITDRDSILKIFEEEKPDGVIHLAAESHVDRSISNPLEFVTTNVIGTVNLLDAARSIWKTLTPLLYEGSPIRHTGLANPKLVPFPVENCFYHISTDEVYGTLGEEGKFTEQTSYDPHSPYSASKASSDHFVRAYHDTFRLPVKLSNCSNNFGTHHFPEKLIPLCIHNIKNNRPLPIYGKGENIRDWLWVEDHARAIDVIFHNGAVGETYNIGGNNEWKNIDLVKLLCDIMDEKLGRVVGESAKLITYVTDRAGHDFRYAIDSSKLQYNLEWKPTSDFRKALADTAQWYLDNEEWLKNVTSGEYMKYYQEQYSR